MITFEPGNITVKYSMMTPPPTRNEALMSINAVDALIHQIKKDNSQVNLTKKEELLRMAIKANDAR